MGDNSYSYDDFENEDTVNNIVEEANERKPSLLDSVNEYSGEIFSTPAVTNNKTADNVSISMYPDDFSANKSIQLDSKSVTSNPPIQNISADYGDDFSSIGNEPSISSLQDNNNKPINQMSHELAAQSINPGSVISNGSKRSHSTLNNNIPKQPPPDISTPIAVQTNDNSYEEDMYADDFTPMTTTHKSGLFSPQPNGNMIPSSLVEDSNEEYDRLVQQQSAEEYENDDDMNDNKSHISALTQSSSHNKQNNHTAGNNEAKDISSVVGQEKKTNDNNDNDDVKSLGSKASQTSKRVSLQQQEEQEGETEYSPDYDAPINDKVKEPDTATTTSTLSAVDELERRKSTLKITELQETLNEMMQEMNEDVHEIHRLASPPPRTITNVEDHHSNDNKDNSKVSNGKALLDEEEALLYDEEYDMLADHSPDVITLKQQQQQQYHAQLAEGPTAAAAVVVPDHPLLQKRGSDVELEMHLELFHQQSHKNLQELYKSSKKLDMVEQSLEQGIVYQEEETTDEHESKKIVIVPAEVVVAAAEEEEVREAPIMVAVEEVRHALLPAKGRSITEPDVEPEELPTATPVSVPVTVPAAVEPVVKSQKISLASLQRYDGSTPAAAPVPTSAGTKVATVTATTGSSKKVSNLRGIVNHTRATTAPTGPTTGTAAAASPPVSRPIISDKSNTQQRINSNPGGWIGPKSAVKIPPNPIPNHPKEINYLASLPKSLLKYPKASADTPNKSKYLRVNIPLGFSIHDACIILEDVCPHRKPFVNCGEHCCQEANIKFQLLTYVRKKAKEAQELIISANDLWKMKLESVLEDAIIKLEQEQKVELTKLTKQLSIQSKNDEYLKDTYKYIQKTKFHKMDVEEGYLVTGGLTQEHCEFVKRQLSVRTEHQRHHLRTILDHRKYEHLQELTYFRKSIESPTVYLESMKTNFLEVIQFHLDRLEKFILFVIHLAVVPRNLSHGKLNQGEEKALHIRFDKACKQAEDLYKTSLTAFAEICANIQQVYCHSDEELPQLLPETVQQRLRAYSANAALKKKGNSPPRNHRESADSNKQPMKVKKKKKQHSNPDEVDQYQQQQQQRPQTAPAATSNTRIKGKQQRGSSNKRGASANDNGNANDEEGEFNHELYEFYGQDITEGEEEEGNDNGEEQPNRHNSSDYGMDFEVIPLDNMQDNPMNNNGFSRKSKKQASNSNKLLEGGGSSVLEYTENDFEVDGGGSSTMIQSQILSDKKESSYYSSIPDNDNDMDGEGDVETAMDEEEEGDMIQDNHSSMISLASVASQQLQQHRQHQEQEQEPHESYDNNSYASSFQSQQYDSQFDNHNEPDNDENENEYEYDSYHNDSHTTSHENRPKSRQQQPASSSHHRPRSVKKKSNAIITKKDLLIANMLQSHSSYNHKLLLQEILKQQKRIHERKQKNLLLQRNTDLHNTTAHSSSPSPSRGTTPMIPMNGQQPQQQQQRGQAWDQNTLHSSSTSTMQHTKYPCFACHQSFSGNGKTFPVVQTPSDAKAKKKARELVISSSSMFADFDKKGELKNEEEYTLLQQQLLQRLMKSSREFVINQEKIFCSWECMKTWTLQCCPLQFRYQSDMLINMCAGYDVKIS